MAWAVAPLVIIGTVEDRHGTGDVSVEVSSSPKVPDVLAGHVRMFIPLESLIESNGASDD